MRTKTLLLGGPGAGKTTELVDRTLSAKAHGMSCLLLSYNVRNVQAAQQRSGLSQRECRSVYSLVLAIYRDIALARHVAPRELVDEGVCRYIARKALVETKQSKMIHLSANMKMAQNLVELADRFIHTTKAIPTDIDQILSEMNRVGVRAQYEYELCKALPCYLNLVRQEGAILFSEMLSVVVQTNERYAQFIDKVTQKLDLLAVDEVQDLTGLELKFIFALIDSASCSVILAGDVNQCVTQYRGADPQYLINTLNELGFIKEQLTNNYRFGSHIAHFASVFQQHAHPIVCKENLYTQLKVEHESFTLPIPTSKGKKALLTRTKEQSLNYQFWLESKGEAIAVNDGQYWKESPLFLALLGWAVMVTEWEIDSIPYLTSKAMIRTMLYFPYRSANEEVIKVLSAEDPKTAFKGLSAASELGANSLGGLPHFLMKAKSQLKPDCTFSEFLSTIIANQHFQVEVRTHSKPYSVLLHLNELVKGSEYKLSSFIELFSTIETQRSKAPIEVMTIHASKGLEFDTVIMAGLLRACIPLPTDTQAEVESLFYVGMTRATKTINFLIPKQGCSKLVTKMIKVGKIA